jgi:hypothetical protein
VPFIVLAASQVFALAFGLGMACAARRRPWAANAIIGAVVMAGFAAIWGGGELASAGLGAGPYVLVAGLICVFVGMPSWGLVLAVQPPDGPVGLIDWARLLARHLASCWAFTIVLGLPVVIFVQLATAPHGSLR